MDTFPWRGCRGSGWNPRRRQEKELTHQGVIPAFAGMTQSFFASRAASKSTWRCKRRTYVDFWRSGRAAKKLAGSLFARWGSHPHGEPSQWACRTANQWACRTMGGLPRPSTGSGWGWAARYIATLFLLPTWEKVPL